MDPDKLDPEGNSSEVPSDCKSLLDKLLDKIEDNKHEDEDDLEEGELKDDDDDDDDDDDEDMINRGEDNIDKDPAKSKESSSDDNSPVRPSSSSSSSSTSSNSKEQSSSKSSSKIGSYHSSSSRNNNANTERYIESRLASNRHISEDRYRVGRDREREDPSEKAAKLISMRTKLLEARSREIELKFQKNKGLIASHQPPPPLITSGLQRNVKMTIAKPSISYNENPNPTYIAPVPSTESKKKVKSKPKSDEKEKKSKKKSKKKKKSSNKKHRKHKSNSVKKSTSDSKSVGPLELELPYENNLDRQGPKTPPDNHVLTLDDVQIDWPSHLIRMTITQPSISYSVNPDSVMDMTNESRKDESITRKRKCTSTSTDRKKLRIDEKRSSISSSPSQRTNSPRNFEENSMHRKYSPLKNSIFETDLTSDYAWYYNYFANSYEMNHHQAQHQAYAAIMSTGKYDNEVLDKWLKSRGLTKLSKADLEIQKQVYPFSLKEQTLSPSGSQNSTSTKPDYSETVDQVTGAKIDRIVTRITRNHVNRDIDEHIESKTEVLQADIKHEPGVVDTINAGNNSENTHGLRNSDLTGTISEPSSQQSETKTENPAEQPSVSTSLNEDVVSLCPVKPRFTIIKSQREIVLPNGHVLPPGTIQKMVHPYPRVDSEVLSPYFDLY